MVRSIVECRANDCADFGAIPANVRPRAVHVHVVEAQRADLRDAERATAREPDDDQVALRVERSLGLLAPR
jgi:hypothetical protein